MMIVSFTGHREIDRALATASLVEVLERLDPDRAIVGGALGADTLAARICWGLRIPYDVALPHRNYPRHYKLLENQPWLDSIKLAESVFYVVDDKPWHFSANFKRNEYMVDHSNVLVSISTFDPHGEIPDKGGTAHCVRYARKIGRQIEWAKT